MPFGISDSMIRLSSLAFILVISAHSNANEVVFPSLSSNVSFTDVLELESNPANLTFVYGTDKPELQYGELWLPTNADMANRAAIVVFIHGGCWLNSFDIAYSHPFSAALARAGYAVWSLEYRRTGDEGGGWPGTYQDIKTGLEYLKKLVDQPIDTENVVITGHSAGGHLALLAGIDYPKSNGVIGLAAISDIASYSEGSNSCQTVTSEFMGGDHASMPDVYTTANPAEKQLHENTILLQGNIDSIVPIEQSQVSGAETVLQEGAGHFDWVHPGTFAFARFLSSLERALGQ